ncbi:MAG: phospholipid/cholesterol/gamma-HCH transport system substrate-binding protein [Solirubrobacteraceae bacterium]|nr:phospholipid/cholesterol/gamma-HCH transport system substrate-binding protein [Solirubrobacteraceae bacterium]
MSAKPILFAVAALAALALVLVLNGSDDRYKAKIVLQDAGGLRKGANVRFDGAPVGKVEDLVLDKNDHALATIRLDGSVAPLGANATALIQADGFFGERYVELNRGDLSKPQPDGTTIPISHSSVSTRLDDLVDSLDTDTQTALKQFINEQGTLIVGRGQDLGSVLAALPPGLTQTGQLLDAFATDNAALGRLVEESDRVVGSVAGQREQFGRMISAAAGTLDALDTRRPQLGQTFQEAPSTLQAARRVLVSLQDAAEPLGPAARGLRNTAPTLTQTLTELPSFADAAVPAFDEAKRVSPLLVKLGTRATPTVQQLRPMARKLAAYTRGGLDGFTTLLQQVTPDLFGTMEGWARSTMGYDNASRIFRFGATSGTDTFAQILKQLPGQTATKREAPKAATTPAPSTAGDAPKAPELPKLPALNLLPASAFDKLNQLLNDTTGKTQETLKDILNGNPGDALKNVLGGTKSDGTQTQNLLDSLLKP